MSPSRPPSTGTRARTDLSFQRHLYHRYSGTCTTQRTTQPKRSSANCLINSSMALWSKTNWMRFTKTATSAKFQLPCQSNVPTMSHVRMLLTQAIFSMLTYCNQERKAKNLHHPRQLLLPHIRNPCAIRAVTGPQGILISLTSPIRLADNITVRVDAATGFQALKLHPYISQLGIDIQVVDTHNENSNAVVDKACLELEREINKIQPTG